MTAVARPATPKLLAGGRAALVVAGNCLGALCVVANWWGTADTDDLSSDLSSAGLAIVGLLVAGLANGFWLLAARGAIARRRLRLSRRVSRWAAPLESASLHVAVPPAATPPAQATDGTLIAVAGTTLYHRPGCPLVARKRTAVAAAEAHEAKGLRPCGVCEPAMAFGQDGTLQ